MCESCGVKEAKAAGLVNLWQVTNVRELWEWYLDGRVKNGKVKVL